MYPFTSLVPFLSIREITDIILKRNSLMASLMGLVGLSVVVMFSDIVEDASTSNKNATSRTNNTKTAENKATFLIFFSNRELIMREAIKVRHEVKKPTYILQRILASEVREFARFKAKELTATPLLFILLIRIFILIVSYIYY